MTTPADVGQAERRTAAGGGLQPPQYLIHRNNSPEPVSMRVSARLTLKNIPASDLAFWLDVVSGPVGQLLLKRRASHGAK